MPYSAACNSELISVCMNGFPAELKIIFACFKSIRTYPHLFFIHLSKHKRKLVFYGVPSVFNNRYRLLSHIKVFRGYSCVQLVATKNWNYFLKAEQHHCWVSKLGLWKASGEERILCCWVHQVQAQDIVWVMLWHKIKFVVWFWSQGLLKRAQELMATESFAAQKNSLSGSCKLETCLIVFIYHFLDSLLWEIALLFMAPLLATILSQKFIIIHVFF